MCLPLSLQTHVCFISFEKNVCSNSFLACCLFCTQTNRKVSNNIVLRQTTHYVLVYVLFAGFGQTRPINNMRTGCRPTRKRTCCVFRCDCQSLCMRLRFVCENRTTCSRAVGENRMTQNSLQCTQTCSRLSLQNP